MTKRQLPKLIFQALFVAFVSSPYLWFAIGVFIGGSITVSQGTNVIWPIANGCGNYP